MSDDRRLYLHDSKRNPRSDVDGLTHTKQLLNLLCIVYIVYFFLGCRTVFETSRSVASLDMNRPNNAELVGFFGVSLNFCDG